jgi:hypothetical protein
MAITASIKVSIAPNTTNLKLGMRAPNAIAMNPLLVMNMPN